MNKHADEVRSAVSKHYANAVVGGRGSGCCGGAQVSKEIFLKLTGYSDQEVAQLPPSAVGGSFGCGNPVALAGLKPGDVVLDVGSGAGLDLLLAARNVGPAGRVIGIDMTDEMIAKANANIRASEFRNIEVRKGFIEEIPVADSSVDWVVSNCVINLSPDKARVFGEIARVLRPGGQMLISDIVAQGIPGELLAEAAEFASCAAGALSEEEYVAGLRAAGLSDVTVIARLIYSADQLEAVLLTPATGKPEKVARRLQLAQEVAGKVWSAEFYARKTDRTEMSHG
jgi:arsenite methyltransferase